MEVVLLKYGQSSVNRLTKFSKNAHFAQIKKEFVKEYYVFKNHNCVPPAVAHMCQFIFRRDNLNTIITIIWLINPNKLNLLSWLLAYLSESAWHQTFNF